MFSKPMILFTPSLHAILHTIGFYMALTPSALMALHQEDRDSEECHSLPGVGEK